MNDDYPMISLNADDLMNDNFRRRRSTCWWIRTLPRPLSFRLVKQKCDRWTRIDKFVKNGLGFKENRNQFFLLLPMLTNCLPSYPARVSLVSIAAFTGFLRNFYLLLELLLIIIYFDHSTSTWPPPRCPPATTCPSPPPPPHQHIQPAASLCPSPSMQRR